MNVAFAELVPWQGLLYLSHLHDQPLDQGLQDGNFELVCWLSVLIPGHVAELHLRSEDLPKAQSLLIRWIVDRLLDDIYEHHDIMWVTNEEVERSAIGPN